MANKPSNNPQLSTAKKIYRCKYSDGDLTFEQFYKMSQQPCFYCGDVKTCRYNKFLKDGSPSQNSIENGWFEYNGLDRINNEPGHNLADLVTCCYRCNYMKQEVKFDEFVNKIEKIYNNLKTRNK